MKLHIFLIFLLNILFCINSFAQDETLEEELEPWQVSEVKFSFLKTKSYEPSQLTNVIAAASGTDLNINTVITDMITLKKFYFDNGFFNAIVDTALSYNNEDNEVVITYTIIENDRSRYNEIDYNGLDSIAPNIQDSIYSPNKDQVQKDLAPGEFYSRAKINLEIGRILRILQNNGYAFAKKEEVKVTNIFSTNPNLQNKVDIQLNFNTGTFSHFGKTTIEISGNRYGITEQYIRRNLEFNEGEVYDQRKLEASNSRILSNAIIESSTFDLDSTSDDKNGIVNMTLKISIRNKYELTPEVLGYEIDNRFYGGLGLSFYDRFFLQGSRVLSASVRGLAHNFKFNRLENQVQVSEAYLFGNPNLAGNIRLGLNFLNIDSISAIEISGKTSVSYDLPTFTYVNKLIFSSEALNQDIRLDLTDSLGQPVRVKINYFASSLGASALHLGIDNPVFPTRGFNQTLTIQEGGLLGQLLETLFDINVFKFIKSTISNKVFFNFSDNIKSSSVLGIKFNIGTIFETGDNTERVDSTEALYNIELPGSPIDLKFTAGGGINNRGWRANTLGFVSNQEEGGNFSIDGMFEHRLRPFINSTNTLIKDLGFVYFLDYGNVWENVKDFQLDQIALSTGFGIRYYTIIGAVRLDLGFKLYDPNPGPVGGSKWLFGSGANYSDKYTIQFGIGNTF